VDIQTWHPLTVHFPIAFLLLSGIFSLYLVFKFQKSLAYFNLILLVLGLIGCGLSIYTGNIEDGKVSRTLCDPTVLKTHENFAYYLLWAFIINLVFWLIKIFVFPKSHRIVLSFLIVLSSLIGSACLIYAGHLGASLVYQQAAGVDVPDDDCSEFN
jgi:uncharacterized membrane protein